MVQKHPLLLLSILIIIITAVIALFFENVTLQIIAKIFKLNSSCFTAENYKGYNYRLCRPTALKDNKDLNKKYPLVVYLHGAGERGSDNRKQSYDLIFLGNGFTKEAQDFQKKYPSFIYVPQCPEGASWSKDTLTAVIKTIEYLLSQYPIDRNRLYLIGYSMGGSGTYALADRYYESNNQLFAGIIRLVGQSSFDKNVHKVIAKSSAWIHVGLKDIPLRVEKAREAYELLKSIINDATETIEPVPINKHPGKTWTLKISGDDRFKETEYTNDGHSISHFPFKDPHLLDWLFSRHLYSKR